MRPRDGQHDAAWPGGMGGEARPAHGRALPQEGRPVVQVRDGVLSLDRPGQSEPSFLLPSHRTVRGHIDGPKSGRCSEADVSTPLELHVDCLAEVTPPPHVLRPLIPILLETA
ncbi:hypothetical protein [Deinococcus navajonensis]|uniref:Uncharacterized protein n=1 Tax=Deinococcus navajonensis TaxID=309884 RepID=A0ABV8XPI9_9DEIO